MGLVIDIVKNNKTIANVYFKDKDNTLDALDVLDDIYHYALSDIQNLTEKELLARIINFAEHNTMFGYYEGEADVIEANSEIMIEEMTRNSIEIPAVAKELIKRFIKFHGGLVPADIDFAQKVIGGKFNVKDIDGHCGLVCISKFSINEALIESTMLVTINLDTNTVFSESLFWEYTKEEYLQVSEHVSDEDFVDIDDIPSSLLNPQEFNFDDIKIAVDMTKIATDTSLLMWNDHIYEFVY